MSEPGDSGERAHEPPKELTAAMQRAVCGNTTPTAEELLNAVEPLLKKVLGANCESRSSALDLLTVDALITRAMEVAAEDPSEMQRVAEKALRTIAEV